MNKCTVDGCDRRSVAKGLCSMHRLRLYRHGDTGSALPSRKYDHPATCSIPGCGRPYRANGFCSVHYSNGRKDIDQTEFHKNKGKGFVNKQGYKMIWLPKHPNARFNGYVLEHIVVMSEKIGRPLDTKHETVHHKNGDRLDNRSDNLELWSKKQPCGQLVEDKIIFAVEILELYKPELLSGVRYDR